jgi:hypothetical protein
VGSGLSDLLCWWEGHGSPDFSVGGRVMAYLIFSVSVGVRRSPLFFEGVFVMGYLIFPVVVSSRHHRSETRFVS